MKVTRLDWGWPTKIEGVQEDGDRTPSVLKAARTVAIQEMEEGVPALEVVDALSVPEKVPASEGV